MAKEGYKDVNFIYAGSREGDKTKILHMYHWYEGDEQPDQALNLAKFYQSKKLFKKDVIGWVRKAQITLDGSNVSYNKDAPYEGKWNNKTEIAKWEALDAAAKSLATILTEANRKELEIALKPVKLAMWGATRDQRRHIIAEVLLILNS